jgi:hypothetical protein
MKYYFLDGIDKKGPYTKAEILSRNLNADTMIYREDKNNWSPLSDFEELNTTETIDVEKSEDKKQIKFDKKAIDNSNKNNKKALIISLISILLVVAGYFIYKNFSLSEEEARVTSNRLFNALLIDGLDENTIKELYPEIYLIGSRIKFNKPCVINNISKNSDGDYEVYATYEHNEAYSYPIHLVISKKNNIAFIKSSKGINYAFYDKVLEYGIKKGCLTGKESDVEIGEIIKITNLRSNLELETKFKIEDLYSNLKTSDDIKMDWGYISGNVTISNRNDFDFDYLDLNCRVEFYDRSGQITSTSKIYIGGIEAHSSASSTIFSSSSKSVKYKIIPTINVTDELSNKMKDKIIRETEYGCY